MNETYANANACTSYRLFHTIFSQHLRKSDDIFEKTLWKNMTFCSLLISFPDRFNFGFHTVDWLNSNALNEISQTEKILRNFMALNCLNISTFIVVPQYYRVIRDNFRLGWYILSVDSQFKSLLFSQSMGRIERYSNRQINVLSWFRNSSSAEFKKKIEKNRNGLKYFVLFWNWA